MNIWSLYKHKNCTDIAIQPLQIQLDYEISRWVVSVQYWNIAHKKKLPLGLFETHMIELTKIVDWKEYQYPEWE